MSLRNIATALLIAATATSCLPRRNIITVDTPSDRLVEAVVPFDSHEGALAILNNSWTILQAGDVNIPTDANDPVQLTFELGPDGIGPMYCYTGCNYINGEVAFVPVKGIVEPRDNFMSTMRACDPEAQKREDAITAALSAMRKFKIEHIGASYLLYLLDNKGNTLLTARRIDADFLTAAWEITEVENSDIPRSADLRLVFDIPLGRVHGNTGCNVLNGTLRLTEAKGMQGIEFSDMASTRRACPDQIEALESEVIRALSKTKGARVSQDGDNLTLCDAQGRQVMKLHRLLLKR